MADISVGSAVGAGFGLIRRKPLTVLAWGLVQGIGVALFLGAYAVLMINMLPVMAAMQPGSQPTDAQTSQILGGMLVFEGGFFLAVIAILALRVVVTAAVWRAVLHPERGGWAYLRVGMAELFIVLLLIGAQFAANIVALPLLPFLFVIAALVAFHQFVAAIVLGVLLIIALIAAVIYLELRFVLLGPMIVDDGRFHFAEGWRLTKGKVGSLFGVGLILVGVALLAEIVIGLLLLIVGGGMLYVLAGGTQPLQAFLDHPTPAFVLKLWPLAVLWAVLGVPITGALSAIMIAPWARAYRDLAPSPGVSVAPQTFA